MNNHYSLEQWKKYVNDELQEEERIQLEDHLYVCDQCLDLYVTAVEAQEELLPTISNDTTFINDIMNQLPFHSIEIDRKEKTKPRFYHSTIFHYAIAASITLILMSTGFFQSIVEHTEMIQNAEMPTKEESTTVRLMDKTISWLDVFDRNTKEDK